LITKGEHLSGVVILKLFRYLPIVIFGVVYASTKSWGTAFKAAGIIAFFASLSHPLGGDRLILALNLFLTTGGLAFLFDIGFVLRWMDELKRGMVFVFIFILAVFFQIKDPFGWPGGRASIFGNDRYFNSPSWRAGWLVVVGAAVSLFLQRYSGNSLLNTFIPTVLIGGAHILSHKVASRADIRTH
jgi:hypothetical protein